MIYSQPPIAYFQLKRVKQAKPRFCTTRTITKISNRFYLFHLFHLFQELFSRAGGFYEHYSLKQANFDFWITLFHLFQSYSAVRQLTCTLTWPELIHSKRKTGNLYGSILLFHVFCYVVYCFILFSVAVGGPSLSAQVSFVLKL